VDAHLGQGGQPAAGERHGERGEHHEGDQEHRFLPIDRIRL
jgi:hypothetical protein